MRKEDFYDASSQRKRPLEIGDKVRFLNNVGGGHVTAFHGKDQVLVEDENGFDVPVLITACVVVGEADKRMENREPQPYLPPVKTVAPPPPVVKAKPVEVFIETPQGERLNIYLAFLPATPKSFIQSNFEAYLINESNYFLYLNFMSCENNAWISRFHGLIEPDTKVFMEEIEKTSLNGLEHICVQMIAFKEGKSFGLKQALSIEIRLDTVKFYKLHCFTRNDFFEDDALVFPLVVNDQPERQTLLSASEMKDAMLTKKEERPSRILKKPAPANNVIEIDLHINQLLDSTAGMNNADMLNCQLSKFHEIIKANAAKKGQKIVFIHGKGEGVLRAAIEKELKTTYRSRCRFQDASFREYGFGASMVIIN